jgi:hypothetical protein
MSLENQSSDPGTGESTDEKINKTGEDYFRRQLEAVSNNARSPCLSWTSSSTAFL